MRKFDPITLEIIQRSLSSASEEMFATIKKTAMSSIIYEVLDMGTAITAANGELASSGSGIPAFVCALDKAVMKIIDKFGFDNIENGDIFLTNDPYFGGVTHLNDAVLVKPVFYDNSLIAWTANIAHWNDVSGAIAGSMSGDATEIFQEGIRYPAIRLFKNDSVIDSVMDIIKANSRMPDFLHGDLWAQIAALRVGEKRIIELVDKYSKSVFVESINQHLEYGEKVAREVISKLKDGSYHLKEKQDDGSYLSVGIEIKDCEITFDLTDAPDQNTGPINLSLDASTLTVQMVLMGVIGSRVVGNGGCFRNLEIKTKQKTIYHAEEPAAAGFYFETMIRLYDILCRCLAENVAEFIPAGGFSSICATILGGVNADTQRQFTIIEPEIGGWGAGKDHDGINAMFCGIHGDTFNCPAEVAETRYGVTVEQQSLRICDAGAGEFRGGFGVTVDYRINSDNSFLTCAYTRAEVPPWPLNGGESGSTNGIKVIRVDGTQESYSFTTGLDLKQGDVVRVETATGAGFGDPLQRSRSRIDDDIKNGYVSLQYAKKVYGY
ncbi:MAG: hydantoinase B/oxoprolinase family protein [Enterobacterales bacterium]|nr:hydantoinase B/oxoprolinase family protein [Enterobacterales bacterium]